MKIIGIQKQTLLDYPGKISATLFTPGCNFRCPFCHNFQIVLPDDNTKISNFAKIRNFFVERKNFLDAVTITGGEPTLHPNLPEVIKDLKGMGYLVKLDTNGTNPSMLMKLLNSGMLDYVAMDIKTSLDFDKYNKAVGNVLTNEMFENIKKSISIIMDSGIDYEFRTTVVPTLVDLDDILNITSYIKGAKNYALQKFESENANTDELRNTKAYSKEQIEEVVSKIKDIGHIDIRGYL